MDIRKGERLALVKAMAADGRASAIRRKARLSLRDVGLAVGVDGSTVGKWEHGARVPRGDAAWRYADLMLRLERAHSSEASVDPATDLSGRAS